MNKSPSLTASEARIAISRSSVALDFVHVVQISTRLSTGLDAFSVISTHGKLDARNPSVV
jgi:hypothetical protein